jgi:uncharacterized membrane protein SpoIIM required for sporulation
MIELLVKPKRAERKPWEMLFIGMIYASISLLLVTFIFSKDFVLGDYGGMLVVTFTVICSLPFMYYIIRLEEGKDIEIDGEGKLIKEHTKAIQALMWLFLGFIIAFAFWYILLPNYTETNFNAQIKVFCQINSPTSYDSCIKMHGLATGIDGNVGAKENILLSIITNNVYVLIFTILFSLIFGAGAIFILAWNASVIAVAMGIFSKSELFNLPVSLARYMIHGIPEIASYFIGALAGGIISVAVIRRDLEGERKWKIMEDALVLVIIAIVILVIAGLIEVYVTPTIF